LVRTASRARGVEKLDGPNSERRSGVFGARVRSCCVNKRIRRGALGKIEPKFLPLGG
jgi:hypothetical protein